MVIPLRSKGNCVMSGVDLLLDTNVVIGLLKDNPAALALLQQETDPLERAGYSAITRMELLGFPGLQSPERKAIAHLLASLEYFPIDRAVEDRAIEIRSRSAVKLPDAIILATGDVHALRLLTLDRRLQQLQH